MTDITPDHLAEDFSGRRDWIKTMGGAMMFGAAGTLTGNAFAAPETDLSANTVSVTTAGAKGDGSSDDTAAFQSVLNQLRERGGQLVIPAGRYRITRPLTIRSEQRLDITGSGSATVLLHEADEPLLHWPDGTAMRESSVRNLTFESWGKDKTPATPIILCAGGTERSFFQHLFFIGSVEPASGGTPGQSRMGSGIRVEKVMDTTSLDHVLMWGPVYGTGIEIARGSEVRIFGGRILGAGNPYQGLNPGNIGVHVTGGNGGVHILTTDLIGLDTAIKIGREGQEKSNREVFLTHCTIDSCRLGLHQIDWTYTSLAGCWAASCDEAQILFDDTAIGAILQVTGGCIFNGGTYGRPGGHNGIVMKQGSFSLSGVAIRHNRNNGIIVGPKVKDYTITGCRIHDNGATGILDGGPYSFTGNVLTRNKKPLQYKGDPTSVVSGNIPAREL